MDMILMIGSRVFWLGFMVVLIVMGCIDFLLLIGMICDEVVGRGCGSFFVC